MGIIRKVKESDYEFIYNSIEQYKLALCYGYTKYIMPLIIENKYNYTVVYEDDGEALAYYSVITHPEEFLSIFYKNMPFFIRIKYLISKQLNAYSSNSGNYEIIENQEHKRLLQDMYKKNGNFAVGLFAYSKCNGMILNQLSYSAHKALYPEYKWMIGMLKKDNRVSIIAHRMLYKNSMYIYDNIDKESYFCVINVDEFLKLNDGLAIKHEIRL